MGKIRKKFKTGNAKNFVTRTQAIKKLQVSLADFRRLCIFKGIYPREPRNKRKANKGSTKPVTFYYSKDIQYLLHEPVLAKFRNHKTFSKKLSRAITRGEISDAKRLNDNKPKYKLDHIIKERYPTFLDALRDLDDPLNMLFLFANMPPTNKVTNQIINNCETICNQWLTFVARERCLKKVFVSIKGIYYQANIKGQNILWLSPYKFPQNIPSDIDFRIMSTFLEFYITLLNFILFKLYTDNGLVFPPKLDGFKTKTIGGLSSFILELENPIPKSNSNITEESNDKPNNTEEAEEAEEAEPDPDRLDTFEPVKEGGDTLIQPSNSGDALSNLFENKIFFVGREVPIDVLEFLILSCGGKIVSEIVYNQLSEKDKKNLEINQKITHQIVDRPVFNKVIGRTYIQPQWVFDSINKSKLLPVSDYAPGETLPPHLSPWGDSAGYNPENPLDGDESKNIDEAAEESESKSEDEIEAEEDSKKINGKESKKNQVVEEDDNDESESEDDDESDDEELAQQKELELELKGVKYSDAKSLQQEQGKKKQQNSRKRKLSVSQSKEDKEGKELAKIMMSRKHRKLYDKMHYSNEKKESKKSILQQKKKKLEKKKQKLTKLKK
ncbi:mRNA-binding ribosome synthesis protein NOP7 ASCRUDRAFT_74604 [Ascoidea rubescens DSM 1968]|uniref:Pescadillo homolog n=1 Tax=Ascoidea rubescens DSM 1968 TaxID=1344418 RepID=A0A1D2VKM4_9ASCO|nr:hypothetical protein ASCRUDRAFT_74604 [Ascoidea rubescens DSM 1968]ODV62163.1 hypothetical protein ASCRUDRAFT_74604 [Ascoidea rubescens DSM 1968]